MYKIRKNGCCIGFMRSTFAAAIIGIMAACPALAIDDTAAYKVAADDVVNVNVARHPEFSGEFYVPADGNVSLPAAGQVAMSGKTLMQIAENISEKLRTRLRKPEVTVSLRTPSRRQVYVLGAVTKPGAYDMKQDWRCAEAIAAAGGVLDSAQPVECKASLRKSLTGQTLTIDLPALLRGDSSANPIVENGDIISIDAPEMMSVYVSGKVKNPGLYKIRKDNGTVLEALALAGGEQDNSATDRIAITHTSGATDICNLTQSIKSGMPLSIPKLQPMDVILVPEETARIAVMGYVNAPGFVPFNSAQKTTLIDALSTAKGADTRANIGSIALIRTENGQQKRVIYNLNNYFKSDDASQNPELKAGDVVYVPQANKSNLYEILGSAAALALAINPFLRR
ncbi:MAG: SLBB domain-containing protein [Armatimonadetes bacterium]|nr:SLBB domain-containing protein [Armatimonadota bacterium]